MKNRAKANRLVAQFFVIPFLIAAAFNYTDWMGWPTLAIGGVLWLGTILQIGKLDT